MTDSSYSRTYPADMGRLKAWIHLSRLPFHTVGIFPFVLGNFLAWYTTGSLNLAIMGWGILGVAFILFATHYSGEYFDYEVDNLSAKLGRNRFSGGSQMLQSGVIPREHALIAAIISLVFAVAVGILLQFYYITGALTIPLGFVGILGGLLYAMKPIRWSYRGIGEVCIGFYYGWLTVATSYYIQTGRFPSLVHWTSLPIVFSIFNVILINEFPDYMADKEAGKQNLVVRFGKKRMSRIYVMMSVAAWLSFILSIRAGIPVMALLFFLPVFSLSIVTTIQVFRGGYEDETKLEGICARTLMVNLGIAVSLILGLWLA